MQPMDEIYQEYARTVYKYLLSKTCNEDLAEELTQETFYQAVRSIDRFDESCKISTWLCALAKNQLFSYQRKHPPLKACREVRSTVGILKRHILPVMRLQRSDWMIELSGPREKAFPSLHPLFIIADQ